MKIDLTTVKSMFLSPGKCNAKIMSFVEKSGKVDGVKFFNIELKITSGIDSGKTVYDSALIAHENEKAVNIGLAKIKSILSAVGIDDSSFDTDSTPNDLLFSEVGIVLKAQKDKDGVERIVVYKYEKAAPVLSSDELPF